jgi:hypothetical protein
MVWGGIAVPTSFQTESPPRRVQGLLLLPCQGWSQAALERSGRMLTGNAQAGMARWLQPQHKPTPGGRPSQAEGTHARPASTCALLAQRGAGSHVGANRLEHFQLLIAGAALLLCTVDARLGRTAWRGGIGGRLARGHRPAACAWRPNGQYSRGIGYVLRLRHCAAGLGVGL